MGEKGSPSCAEAGCHLWPAEACDKAQSTPGLGAAADWPLFPNTHTQTHTLFLPIGPIPKLSVQKCLHNDIRSY